MAILKWLAGLPLAPVTGLVVLARQLQKQARQEEEQELAQLQAELLEKVGALASLGADGDSE